MAAISVIVPVYNVEDCLDWCLDSLVVQTLSDIEIICVNDGSPDGSRAILERRAQEDPRIVIVDKENGGLSSARNAGIARATSPYVCFLDSDDRFLPQACERMVEEFERTGADVLTFGANPYPAEDSYHWLDVVLDTKDAVYDRFDISLMFSQESWPFAWRTACRTEFLRNSGVIFDETLPFGEDTAFQFQIYPRSGKTVLISDKLYDYRVQRNGSLMDRQMADTHGRMREHVEIVSRVFVDWAKLPAPEGEGAKSLLHRYASEMIDWTTELVLYRCLKLADDSWHDIADAMHELWNRFWTDDELQSMNLPAAARDIVDVVLESKPGMGRRARTLVAYRSYAHRYGKRALVEHWIGRLKAR